MSILDKVKMSPFVIITAAKYLVKSRGEQNEDTKGTVTYFIWSLGHPEFFVQAFNSCCFYLSEIVTRLSSFRGKKGLCLIL